MRKISITELEEKVYQIVTEIPKGKVMTYGQIARYVGANTPRIIGRIMHNNENPKIVPCHRVVFSDGHLAPAYAFGGQEVQKARLVKEGVSFKGNKVDLKKSKYVIS